MSTIVRMNPFRCRMWMHHDRLEEHVTEESCKSELASFHAHGQLLPVLGRTLRGDRDHDVELIYGARRLFVARQVNLPLLVELRGLSDLEAIVAMDIENRQRVDLSPYERGMCYARWLQAGHFKNQDELARTLRTSASVVSRLLKIARLPPVVIEAFPDPTEIRERWGASLETALEDPVTGAPVVQTARSLARAHERASARDVFRQLMLASTTGSKPSTKRRAEVVSGESGEPLFRVREQADTIALVLPAQKISAKVLEAIRDVIAEILQRDDADVLPRPAVSECAPEESISGV